MNDGAKNADFAHPHDLLVRSFLTDEDLAADFFQSNLHPDLVRLLDLKRLRCESPVAIDENLAETLADLRYSTFFKGTRRQLRVFVFLEHQSKPDRFISLRLLEYVCGAYRRHLSASDTKKSGQTLPYPLAVVLHNGKKPWGKIPPIGELIDTVPGVDSNVLRMPVHLVDLPGIPPEQLRGNAVVRALLDCLQSAPAGRLADRYESIAGGLAAVRDDPRIKRWVTSLTKYTASQCTLKNGIETVHRVLNKIFTQKEADTMALTLADELRIEGEIKGEAKGRTKGMSASLVRVLAARFGKVPGTLEKKIRACDDQERLDALLETAAICRSLAEFKEQFK